LTFSTGSFQLLAEDRIKILASADWIFLTFPVSSVRIFRGLQVLGLDSEGAVPGAGLGIDLPRFDSDL
jgi:hypothetical protein